MLITTSRKTFDNPKTRKIRKDLRKRLTMGLPLPTKAIEILLKHDKKAALYFQGLMNIHS